MRNLAIFPRPVLFLLEVNGTKANAGSTLIGSLTACLICLTSFFNLTNSGLQLRVSSFCSGPGSCISHPSVICWLVSAVGIKRRASYSKVQTRT